MASPAVQPPAPRIITLTTDFGQADGYVGMMKGVILGYYPPAQVVDLSHEIAPQDVAGGAFVLYRSYTYFPPDTIHVAVVDPGVGSTRQALALVTERGLFVGPDNGLFTYVLRDAVAQAAGIIGERGGVPPVWNPVFDLDAALVATPPARLPQAYALMNPTYWLPAQSATFHGRDVFAPVAAHLARGLAPAHLGPTLPLEGLTLLPHLTPQLGPDLVEGRVISIDRFGNLITNIAAGLLPRLGPLDTLQITLGRYRLHGVQPTYAAAPIALPMVLINSAGLLEIAVRDGHAAHELGVGLGTVVRCRTTGE
jgi:S-adenosylmethionine hydrolase